MDKLGQAVLVVSTLLLLFTSTARASVSREDDCSRPITDHDSHCDASKLNLCSVHACTASAFACVCMVCTHGS